MIHRVELEVPLHLLPRDLVPPSLAASLAAPSLGYAPPLIAALCLLFFSVLSTTFRCW